LRTFDDIQDTAAWCADTQYAARISDVHLVDGVTGFGLHHVHGGMRGMGEVWSQDTEVTDFLASHANSWRIAYDKLSDELYLFVSRHATIAAWAYHEASEHIALTL